MARIPVRFQRVAAAFAFDADMARVRLCESSGSEHSPESTSTDDLSVLVKSFMEKNERSAEEEGEKVVGGGVHHDLEDNKKGDDDDDEEEEVEKSECSDSEKKGMLQGLFAATGSDDERKEKEKIRREVELACGLVGEDYSFPGFKRRLMSQLREKGFDAGQ